MSIPKIIPALVLAGVAAVSSGFITAGTVGASSSVDDAEIVLDQLCTDRGGTPYSTPYSIVRCQFARANKGFDTEREVCEQVADGEFVLALATKHMNRASWGCSPTSPT